jgi:hypothetical protein
MRVAGARYGGDVHPERTGAHGDRAADLAHAEDRDARAVEFAHHEVFPAPLCADALQASRVFPQRQQPVEDELGEHSRVHARGRGEAHAAQDLGAECRAPNVRSHSGGGALNEAHVRPESQCVVEPGARFRGIAVEHVRLREHRVPACGRHGIPCDGAAAVIVRIARFGQQQLIVE